MYRTAIMVVFNTVGCLVIGYPLAYWISRKTGKRKTLFIVLLMVPFLSSFLIRTYAWMIILGDNGLLNSLLMKLHLIHQPLHVLYTMKAVGLGLIYDYLPFMVLPLFVSIEKIDRSLIEASKDLGAGKWVTFRRVTPAPQYPWHRRGLYVGRYPHDGRVCDPLHPGR